MALERGLGKGLGALLGDAALQSQEGGSLSLPISQVEPGLKQPRKRFDEESLQDLADSIRIHGIIQPLTVRRLSSGYYQIIAGERRWRAAKLAGITDVPVLIREYDKQQTMEIALIENVQRADLNPIEEAQAFQQLIQEFHLTQEEIANRVSKNRATITNSMRLLKLDVRVQDMLADGKISSGHARALLGLEEGERQYQVAVKITEEKLSVRDVEKLVKMMNRPPKEKKPEKVQVQQEKQGQAEPEKDYPQKSKAESAPQEAPTSATGTPCSRPSTAARRG